MSFDPSFQYTQGIGAGAPDITGTPAGVDPSEDPTRNEYYTQRLLTPPWIQAGFPDYQSYAANLRLKEELSRAQQERQINAPTNAAGVSASITTQGANQRAAVQAQIDSAKNNADAEHNAAMDALAKGNAADARAHFARADADLERYHQLDIQVRQQEANTATQTAGYNIYKDLTDKASNPRNFMQSFFTNRGATPPPGSGAYGNTAMGPGSIMPFEQWLPNFMTQTLGNYGNRPSSPGAGAAYSPAASAPPPTQNAQGQSWQPGQVNPYAGTNTNYGGSPTTADTAMINGVKTWAGGAYSGKPVDQSPADAGDLTPYLKNPNTPDPTGRVPQQFADGGTLRMTAPHAIVNMLSGKVAAIAGEQPGRGPQGFVPETARFNGQAIIDPNKAVSATDPQPPDGSTGYQYSSGAVPIGPSAPASSGYDTTDTTDILNAPPPTTSFPGDPSLTSTYNYPQGSPTPPPPSTPTASSGLTPALIAQAQAAAAAANSALPAGAVGGSTPSTTTPPKTSTPFFFGGVPETPAPNTTFTPPTNPVNSWGGPMIQPTTPTAPLNFTPPSFLSSTPSGLGQNPQFLPEDAAAKDPIVAQMLAAGSFPPFLQRLYAQAKGLPGLGTNVPQTTDLPAGVPLVSKLAYNQMSPSEQQAFASFLSAHGITLEDYLTMVEAASPQGGTSPANPAVPKFLSQGG